MHIFKQADLPAKTKILTLRQQFVFNTDISCRMYMFVLPLLVHVVRDGKQKADPAKIIVFLPVRL